MRVPLPQAISRHALPELHPGERADRQISRDDRFVARRGPGAGRLAARLVDHAATHDFGGVSRAS